MPETISFRGVILRDMDLRQSAKGASTFVRMHLSSDFTDQVRNALQWEDLPGSYKGGTPANAQLTGVDMTIRPNSLELKQYAFKMPIRQVRDFAVVTVKDGDDEIRQLNFTVETTAKRAYSTVGKYIEAMGHGKGQLRISYATEDENPDGTKQEDLLTTDEMRNAAAADSD